MRSRGYCRGIRVSDRAAAQKRGKSRDDPKEDRGVRNQLIVPLNRLEGPTQIRKCAVPAFGKVTQKRKSPFKIRSKGREIRYAQGD